MNLYKRVELVDGELVQFVGCYALKWHYEDWGMPEVAFVEIDVDYDEALERLKASEELIIAQDVELAELRQKVKEYEACLEVLTETMEMTRGMSLETLAAMRDAKQRYG